MGYIYRVPTAFTGAGAASLPTLLETMPVAGAAHRWEVASLPADGAPITSWVDVAGDKALTVATGTPTVATVDGLKAARFTSAILQTPVSMGQPHTVALAFKHVTLNTVGSAAVFGAQATIGADGGILQTNTVGDFYANAGAALKVGSVSAKTGWHRLLVVFNGAASVVSLNGTEFTGNAGALPRALFSLGGQRNGQFTDIAVRHASLFPRALTSVERSTLSTWMAGKVA